MAKKDKAKKQTPPPPPPKKSKKQDKKPVEKAKAKEEPKKKKKGGDWDETDAGGKDFFKLPAGTSECLVRVRSVISMGQCVHEFKGKKDKKATSTVALVIEAWPFKIKKDNIKITSEEPAIVYHTMKALTNNDKSHYTKMKKDFNCKTPADLQDAVGMGEIFTSDKGYMYLRQAPKKCGLAERKACPKLTQEGFIVPNLDAMTIEALKELNPITQVKDYVLEAVNYTDSEAEKLVAKIRKDKPDFAKLSEDKKGKKTDKADKKGKKKKKKLDEDKEY